MKKLFFLLVPFLNFGQEFINVCDKLSKINSLIQENHYKSKPIDDSLSVYVFEAFIDELDPDKRLFTEIEIKDLNKYYNTIDNSIMDKKCDFISIFYKTYNQALERYKKTLDEFKKVSYVYKSSETIQYLNQEEFAKDEKELKNFFRKRILFNVLRNISEKSKNKDSLLANFDKISKTSREKTFDSYECQYSKLKITENDFTSKFLNVFCSYFDPHTMYLSKSDKSSFLSNVSSDDFSFGMSLSLNEKDEVVVDDVIPGGAAYYSKKVEKSDQILKLKYLSEILDVNCTNLSKIEEIYSSNNYKTVEFTFRKKNGEIYSVELTKKLMKIYDNVVFSYILNKNNKKIGYLKIPSFYAVFENGKSNVSEDVAKEIYKLKADKIEGLIIDLQYNGGGSMQEAISMIGSFIDVGPIALLHNKLKEREIIKDINRGNIYNDPMVVLINGYSASASELFANAMQDYNRAIIIGNKSFGKASMQQIVPLTMEKDNEEFVKLTIEKFHNITGKTNQYIGITPDVEIPALFDKQISRENENKTALKNDVIESVTRYSKYNNPNKDRVYDKIHFDIIFYYI